MAVRHPRYSKEEFIQWGNRLNRGEVICKMYHATV
jgi:hypothetical protein